MNNKLEVPIVGSRWIHRVSGKVYTVAIIANLESTRPSTYPITVVYQERIGTVWSRPLDRWHVGMKRL